MNNKRKVAGFIIDKKPMIESHNAVSSGGVFDIINELTTKIETLENTINELQNTSNYILELDTDRNIEQNRINAMIELRNTPNLKIAVVRYSDAYYTYILPTNNKYNLFYEFQLDRINIYTIFDKDNYSLRKTIT